jgi:deoxyribodipyrimidine photolyase
VAVRAAMAKAEGKLDVVGEKYLKEILWREFSYSILYHWPSLRKLLSPGIRCFPMGQ